MTPTALVLLAVMVFMFVGLPFVADHAYAAQKYVVVEPASFWSKFFKVLKKVIEIITQFIDCIDGRRLAWDW